MPPAPGPLDLPDLANKTILIVDDNEDHLDLLWAFLKACNAKVLMARNADAALAYLHSVPVDMLISDLAMPGMDGISLIRAVRASPGRDRTIPAIALTGFPKDFANARAHGFDAFLQKPVKPDALGTALRNFFGT